MALEASSQDVDGLWACVCVSVACPSKCHECTYSSTLSRTVCSDGRCYVKHTNVADGSCGGTL